MRFLIGLIVGIVITHYGYLDLAKDFMMWMDMIRIAIANFLLSF